MSDAMIVMDLQAGSFGPDCPPCHDAEALDVFAVAAKEVVDGRPAPTMTAVIGSVPGRTRSRTDRSFLVLFFKKELLFTQYGKD